MDEWMGVDTLGHLVERQSSPGRTQEWPREVVWSEAGGFDFMRKDYPPVWW